MTSEPMTAEQFAAINARHQEVKRLYGEFWVDAGPTDADLDAVLAEVERLRCTDPIECGHEAALGQAQAEVERLNGVVQFLGSHLQRDSLDIVDELRRQAAESEPLLSAKSVEAFLKRERDEHGKESYWWRSLDEALDAFRLHMVTGTPLTEPRPHGGPEAFGVGKEPLTEAEELRAELRVANEQLAAVWALVEPWRSADFVSASLRDLVYGLLSIRDRADVAAESSSPTEEKG